MKHSLKKTACRNSTHGHPSGSCASRRLRRLRLEPLEDRRLLTTFFVDGDIGSNANPGTTLLPFATIQRGIDEAASASGDDIVEVAPALGGYTENLSIADTSGALALRGSTGTATDVFVSGSGSNVITISLIHDVTLESLHARGGGVGILVTGGSADLVVDNVRSSNHAAGGLVVRAAGDVTVLDTEITQTNYGMYLENFSDLLVEGTDSSGNRFDGIFANRGNSVVVYGSVLDGNRSEGIYASNILRIDLEETSLSNNGDNGADIWQSGDITMTDLTVIGADSNASGVFANFINSMAVTGGDYSNNSFDGISVFNISSTVDMTNVTATGNNRSGARIGGDVVTSGADSVTIQGGEFSGNAVHGIDVGSARQSVAVSDVTVANNDRNGLSVLGSTAAAPVTVSGGVYTGNQYHAIKLKDVGGATIQSVQATGNGSNFLGDGTGGGGISIHTASPEPILIEDVNVSDNQSRGNGGGIEIVALSLSHTPAVTIRDSTVANNSNQFAQVPGGGGIAVTYASLSISGSTISGNRTGIRGGGGLYLSSTESEIVNTTISGNQAPFSRGGGIHVRNGSQRLTITNATVTENVAATGGGIFRASGVVSPLNTIIAANSARRGGPDYYGSVNSLGNNLLGNASGVFGTGFTAPGDQAGTSGSPIDPLLGPLQNNGGPTDTHELLLGSPAINAGNNTGAPTTDQRGVSRPQGGTVDVGAYELILNLPPVADAGGPYSVDEGGSVPLDASGSTDESPSTLFFEWDLDGDGIFGEVGVGAERGDEVGVAPTFSAAGLDGPNTVTVDLRVTDEGDLVATDSADIEVENVDPAIDSITSPDFANKGIEGTAITVSGTFSDAGVPDTHTGTVSWGDGAAPMPLNVITDGDGTGTFDGTHTYTDGGIYTITITILDDDGGSTTQTTTAVISGVGVQSGVLYVIGTASDDHVSVNRQGNGLIKVHADFLPNGNFKTVSAAGVDKIIAYLCEGDDHMTIAGSLPLPAIVLGGAGNDHLNAGGGPSLLIGGAGTDRLVGGKQDDVLIGGVVDNDESELMSALDSWDSSLSYDARVSAVDAVLAVVDDEEEDKLTGASGRDLFFDGLDDDLTDVKTKKNAESVI